jgi:hypothetical protein
MARLIELKQYVARLAQQFDQTLHAPPEKPVEKGWGQFLSAEHHQVGLYGTCSGVLVKTIALPSSPIDEGITTYLARLWGERHGNAERYFNQTVRLAFLVLALARVQVPQLVILRAEVVKELVARQRTDGAWGDWGGGDAPPRVETTAWAVLALARLQEAITNSNAVRGAAYLQAQVLAVKYIAQTFDAFILGVILHVLPEVELNQRVPSAALQVLGSARPTNDLQIYFFDFPTHSGDGQEFRRDFLCVPRFFGYCLLATAPSFGPNLTSVTGFRVGVAHQRSLDHVEAILVGEPLHSSRSRYPATVDQAFVALSAEYLAERKLRFSRLIRIVRSLYGWMQGNLIVRIILPLAIVTFLGLLAKDPETGAKFAIRLLGGNAPSLSALVKEYSDIIQFAAISVGFLVSEPLVESFYRFIKNKWQY